MSLYRWSQAAADVFFPQRHCVNCGSLSPGEPLCPDCRGKMRGLRSCPHCASFIALTESEHYFCADCRHKAPAFGGAHAALPYAGHLRDVLIAFKYEGKTGYRRPLAALLAEQYRLHYSGLVFDAVVPVPLHTARLRQRGYNQAELLSRLLAAEICLPHRPELLSRSGETPPLADLGRRERIAALSGAFQAAPEAKGLWVLLVDDIFTSGATVESCSRALLGRGAKSVYVLTVAAGHALL